MVPTPIHQPHQKSSIEADHILTNLQNESPKFLRPTTAFRSTRQRSITLGTIHKLRHHFLGERDTPNIIEAQWDRMGEYLQCGEG